MTETVEIPDDYWREQFSYRWWLIRAWVFYIPFAAIIVVVDHFMFNLLRFTWFMVPVMVVTFFIAVVCGGFSQYLSIRHQYMEEHHD